MNFIKLLVLCYSCLLFSLKSFGAEYSLRYFYKVPIPAGGWNENVSGFQNPTSNTSGEQAEFLCVLTDSRFLFGVGLDKEHKHYFLVNSETKTSRKFESDYESFYLRAGYSHILEKGNTAELGARIGHGQFDFKESNNELKEISNVNSLGLDAKLIKAYDFNKLKLEFIGGVGIQKAFVPSFHYNDRDFSSDDFDIGVNIFFGIGFSL